MSAYFWLTMFEWRKWIIGKERKRERNVYLRKKMIDEFQDTDANTRQNERASIAAFYAGRSIFVTGGTGFLGKVLIEKLLRSCPDVREIFMLIRPKRGLSIDERLKKMFDLPVSRKMSWHTRGSKVIIHVVVTTKLNCWDTKWNLKCITTCISIP